MDYLDKLALNPPASAKSVAAFVKKAAKALKVDASKIPTDYLAFLQRADGASGGVGDKGAWLRLDPMEEVLKSGKDYQFAGRGWLYIGGDGAGTGYGIDLVAEPPAYLSASYIDMTRVYLGHTLEAMLEALASGQLPPQPGEAVARPAAPGKAGMVRESSVRGGAFLGWTARGNLLLLRRRELIEFDPIRGEVAHSFEPADNGDAPRITAAAQSPDGKITVACVARRTATHEFNWSLAAFDTSASAALWAVSLPDKALEECHLFFMPDDASVGLQAQGQPLRFFAAMTGAAGKSFAIATQEVSPYARSADIRLAVSPNGSEIAVVDAKSWSTRLYDAGTGEPATVPFGGMAVSWGAGPEERLLLVEFSQVRVVDPRSGKVEHAFAVTSAADSEAVMTPDGRLVALDIDGLRTWDLASGMSLGQLRHVASKMSVSRDGRMACTWDGGSKSVRLWRLPGLGVPAVEFEPPRIDPAATETHEIALLPGALGPIQALRAGGTTLAAATKAGMIHLWDTESWTVRREIREPSIARRDISLCADGGRLMGLYRGQWVRGEAQTRFVDGEWALVVWDTTSGQEVARLGSQQPAPAPAQAVLAPAGDAVWLAQDDLRVLRWDVVAGTTAEVGQLSAAATCAAVSPDGRIVGFGTASTVELFDAQAGAKLGVIVAKEGPVERMAFSDRAEHLLTVHPHKTQNDAVVAVHDVGRLRQMRKFDPIEDVLSDVVWLPGNRQFIVGSRYDWKAFRYSIERGRKEETLSIDLAQEACACMARVGEQILVMGGGDMSWGPRTWSLRIWQLVANSKPSKRVAEE